MKIERKYMAHYLNTVFAGDTGTAAYVRLGKDLEEGVTYGSFSCGRNNRR